MSRYLIKNAIIVDGNRLSQPYISDVLIEDEYIKDIYPYINQDFADKVIDATGLYLTPGFIDSHSHSDYTHFTDHYLLSKLYQGITTEINGNCGASAAPLYGQMLVDERKLVFNEYKKDVIKWNSFLEYLNNLENIGLSLNVAQLVGHAMLRGSIVGLSANRVDIFKQKEIAKLLELALFSGAIGMSTGLAYEPDSYSSQEELVFLAKILKKRDRIYTSHIRDEGEFVFSALSEFFNIVRESKVSGQISHIKTAFPNNLKSKKVIQLIYSYRARGYDIFADFYPYTAFYTSLSVLLPDFAKSGYTSKFLYLINKYKQEIESYLSNISEEQFKRIYPAKLNTKKYKSYLGKSIYDISIAFNQHFSQILVDLFINEQHDIPAIFFFIDKQDLKNFLKEQFIMVCTDSEGIDLNNLSDFDIRHPRTFNTYIKILKEYVKEKKQLSISEAIYKFSKLPATRFKLNKRGEIKKGYYADINLIDLNSLYIDDNYFTRRRYPEGIKYMFINGKLIIEDGKYNKVLSGKVLRYAG